MGHRRWLPQNHVFRRRKKEFDNTEEMELAPITMSGSSALRMLQGRVFVLGKKVVVAKKGKGKKKGKDSEKGTEGPEKQKRKRAPNKKSGNVARKPEKKPEDCFKKKSIFFDLEYWEHNKLRHNLDVMHIEKNVFENLIGTLLDIDSKTKDGLNARLDLGEIGIRSSLQPHEGDKGKTELPHAPFNMYKEKKEILCTVIKNCRTPDGCASNFSRCVNMKELTLTGLKSHDCHVILQDILPVALLHCYPSKDVMILVVELANFFKKLCSKVLDFSELDKLQESIVKTLCNMEKVFLPSFFTVMVHLMVHLVEEAKLGGPVHYRWMYPLERSFVWLKSLVRNRAYPEGSIAEGYTVSRHFADWLEQKVILDDGSDITEKIRALAAKPSKCGVRYSGYIIKGFRFHTISRKTGRVTQNSGVVNLAENGVSYYGRLSDIFELSYKDYKVVFFTCDWGEVRG
nr:uncharacterized protein LOC109747017 isoform X3 [Aegilops tauschii subsp. strangulata]